MAKGSIVAWILPLRCFLFLLPNYTNILVCVFLFALFTDEPEVFIPKYSQTAILHGIHFRRVVVVNLLPDGHADQKWWMQKDLGDISSFESKKRGWSTKNLIRAVTYYMRVSIWPIKTTGSWGNSTGRWREATPYLIVFFIHIGGEEAKKWSLLYLRSQLYLRIIIYNLEIIKQECTLKSNMVEPAYNNVSLGKSWVCTIKKTVHPQPHSKLNHLSV